MPALVLVLVALMLCLAVRMDRTARKRGSEVIGGAEMSRRFRRTHRLARDRQMYNGNVPGPDWTKYDER